MVKRSSLNLAAPVQPTQSDLVPNLLVREDWSQRLYSCKLLGYLVVDARIWLVPFDGLLRLHLQQAFSNPGYWDWLPMGRKEASSAV